MAQALRAPFDKSEIEYLPKGGRSLAYVGHARVTDRLIQVDPDWTLEPLAVNQNGSPMFEGDEYNRPQGLWVKLTVGGVTRIGYGTTEYHDRKNPDTGEVEHKPDPEAIKKILSDALRNAAMRFGVGLDLWTKEVGDDVGSNVPAPGTARGENGHVVKPSALPTLPVSQSPTFPKPAGDEAFVGRSIGTHEHDAGADGQYIIKRSKKTGKLYAQCNAKNVVIDGESKAYCNTFPAYGALEAWQKQQEVGDVNPDDVPDLPNVSVPAAVVENNHHTEFIKAAMDAEFSVARPWIKGFDNDRLIAFVEHLEDKVPPVTLKKLH